MIEIWGRASSSNVQKVLWCCSELGLGYERYDIGREFGGNNTPEYLKMNPNGLVPTIRDDGLIVWESNTIQRYLAAKYGDGVIYPTDAAARTHVDRWLDWEAGTLAPTIHPVFWGLVRTPPEQRDLAALSIAQSKLTDVFAILDRHLSDRKFIGGNGLTLADIAMGNSAYRWYNFAMTRPEFPGLKAWYEIISQRFGFREHIARPMV
ncbi:MAG: glutathione S-transferase family protein [Bradyrhizobium sp.]